MRNLIEDFVLILVLLEYTLGEMLKKVTKVVI